MNWLSNNLDLVLALTLQHLRLSVLPILLGFVLAVPVGYVAHRFRGTRGILLTVAGLLYTIPSLALLVVLPAVTGLSVLSEANLEIALTVYAVAILARSVADALDSVDPDVRQAARALGYSGWRRFWSVDFRLAGPVMLAGLRVAAVSTVALVTVGILVGVQSLGYLFTNGFQRRIVEEVLAGVVMTMIVALVLDQLLALAGRALLPWARAPKRRRAALAREAVV
ncbi:MAG: transporter permease [Naasia sp.]|uniref:ABC transporter permease n=1 Tax=Naasia sp. TaxID=2546198 RepID=UPI00262406E2|nr:ABC transporter permease [Naasia sp.]MCU1570763.1 transporter permease [Naasia sp.]